MKLQFTKGMGNILRLRAPKILSSPTGMNPDARVTNQRP